ncbi:hypothetical protein DFH08DRAFT_978574 [Mycena albidolilacea]|uniref:Uncharacterized protein n=1 Tax=Mycena albidolilacea TaxID=1033008 RepID=A0AAD6YYA6_9AGAR|nr:hypothetical protein DFH08DRAFT_978574 [Mycena albidolilacea]
MPKDEPHHHLPRKHGQVKKKPKKQTEELLSRIDWDADKSAAMYDLIAQMEVKENHLVLFGKQGDENTSGESKIAVYKCIGSKIFPAMYATSPKALGNLVTTYKKHVKKLQQLPNETTALPTSASSPLPFGLAPAPSSHGYNPYATTYDTTLCIQRTGAPADCVPTRPPLTRIPSLVSVPGRSPTPDGPTACLTPTHRTRRGISRHSPSHTSHNASTSREETIRLSPFLSTRAPTDAITSRAWSSRHILRSFGLAAPRAYPETIGLLSRGLNLKGVLPAFPDLVPLVHPPPRPLPEAGHTSYIRSFVGVSSLTPPSAGSLLTGPSVTIPGFLD